jgi:TolB-like protein/AraC-like DNA-binding protein
MSVISSTDQAFINRLTEIILANLENEQFDVDELATEAGMSRSYILQKLTSIASKSTTRFIREVRLQRAMEMLQHGEKTAAEVAYSVGFGTPAYFNSCFHEFYGYPPGKVIKNSNKAQEPESITGIGESFTLASESLPVAKKQSHWNFSGSQLLVFAFIGLLVLLLLAFPVFKISKKLTTNRLGRADKSISVLPFKNLSNQDDNQYFADGVTDNIVNNLVQIQELRVVPISPIKGFGNNPADFRGIATRLGVNFLLTGSVQSYGTRVRIIVQLIDVERGHHLWSEKYDRELSDIFFIESEIAQQVADALEATLSPREIEQIVKIPTRNIEAYNWYLMGRFFWNRRTEDGVKKSIGYFTRAVEADPDYALAWAGLGDAYSILAGYGWYKSRAEGEVISKNYLRKALELDKNLAETHAALGRILTFTDCNWDEADKELRLAIRLKPNYAPAHQYYSQLLDIKGDYRNARVEIDRALKLDPLAPIMHRISGDLFYDEGNFKESLRELQEAIDLERNYETAHWTIFLVYYKLGEGARALSQLKTILLLNTTSSKYVDTVGFIYEKYGLTGLIDWTIKIKPIEPTINHIASLTELYALSGRKEEALASLEKSLKYLPGDALVRLINNRNYETLRSEPRFKAVVDKLGLTEYYLKRLNQPGYIPNQ